MPTCVALNGIASSAVHTHFVPTVVLNPCLHRARLELLSRFSDKVAFLGDRNELPAYKGAGRQQSAEVRAVAP